MKKILSLIMASILLLSLSACTGKDKNPQPAPTATTEKTDSAIWTDFKQYQKEIQPLAITDYENTDGTFCKNGVYGGDVQISIYRLNPEENIESAITKRINRSVDNMRSEDCKIAGKDGKLVQYSYANGSVTMDCVDFAVEEGGWLHVFHNACDSSYIESFYPEIQEWLDEMYIAKASEVNFDKNHGYDSGSETPEDEDIWSIKPRYVKNKVDLTEQFISDSQWRLKKFEDYPESTENYSVSAGQLCEMSLFKNGKGIIAFSINGPDHTELGWNVYEDGTMAMFDIAGTNESTIGTRFNAYYDGQYLHMFYGNKELYFVRLDNSGNEVPNPAMYPKVTTEPTPTPKPQNGDKYSEFKKTDMVGEWKCYDYYVDGKSYKWEENGRICQISMTSDYTLSFTYFSGGSYGNYSDTVKLTSTVSDPMYSSCPNKDWYMQGKAESGTIYLATYYNGYVEICRIFNDYNGVRTCFYYSFVKK